MSIRYITVSLLGTAMLLSYTPHASASPLPERQPLSALPSGTHPSAEGPDHRALAAELNTDDTLSPSEKWEARRIITMDVARAADQDLLVYGVRVLRDNTGSVVGYQATDEMIRSVFISPEARVRLQAWEWAACAAGLGWFIAQTVFPVGKVGAIAVKLIGIVKRWGIGKTIRILQCWGKASDYETKQFFKDFALAASGIATLQPCTKAIGL